MIGNFKIIGIMFLLFCNCKKQDSMVENGRELITQNINVLLDSIETFDISKMPVSEVSKKDFKNYRHLKIEQIKIGLLDSIIVEKACLKNYESIVYLKFNLSKKEIINFKSNYKIDIKKNNNYDVNVLFVRFSNFVINDKKAQIIVKKMLGISMVKERYYFEKQNGMWIFRRKEFLNMG